MNRRILTIILAVALAVLGTAAVLAYVSRADARALEGQEAVTVLVADKPIPAGTRAGAAAELLRAERMPAASVPSDALAVIDKGIEDLVTSADLQQGQLLARGMLVAASSQDDVVLPDGKVAVTIPIEEGNQDTDSLRSGFTVAVFDTFTVERGVNGLIPSGEELTFGDDKNQATRLLLPSVEVIGVAAEKPQTEDSSGGFGKLLISVAVTQSEAERLIHALNTGTVSLAQVNDDSRVKPGPGVDNHRLFQNGN